MAVLFIGIIYPMINKKNKIGTITFWSMIAAYIFVIAWPIFETAVMSAEVMKQYGVVCMQIIRCAELTRYLPRFELILVSFFTFSIFIQSAVLFYSTKYSIKQVTGFKGKKEWWIYAPLTPVLIYLTYAIAHDHNHYIKFVEFPYPQAGLGLCTGLLIILYAAAIIKGKFKSDKREGMKTEEDKG